MLLMRLTLACDIWLNPKMTHSQANVLVYLVRVTIKRDSRVTEDHQTSPTIQSYKWAVRNILASLQGEKTFVKVMQSFSNAVTTSWSVAGGWEYVLQLSSFVIKFIKCCQKLADRCSCGLPML
jgi:hypothetical protein